MKFVSMQGSCISIMVDQLAHYTLSDPLEDLVAIDLVVEEGTNQIARDALIF